MRKFIWLLLFFPVAIVAAEETAELQEETELKFAIYSSAWGENTDDGLRIVAFNQTQGEIRLNSIVFPKSTEDTEPVSLQLALDVPSFGYADIEAKRPFTTEELLPVASISKPFLGSVMMALVDQGKLKLDDPVEKYLPEFKGKKVKGSQSPARPMTVRHLL